MVIKLFGASALSCAFFIILEVPAAIAEDLAENAEREWTNPEAGLGTQFVNQDQLDSVVASFREMFTLFSREVSKLQSQYLQSQLPSEDGIVALDKDEVDTKAISLMRQNNPPPIWLDENGGPTVIRFPGTIRIGFRSLGSDLTIDRYDDTMILNAKDIPAGGETLIVLLNDKSTFPLKLMPSNIHHPADVVVTIEQEVDTVSGKRKIELKRPIDEETSTIN